MFFPLYIKTEYSLLESTIKIKDLIKYALEHNYKALAITDNNLYGTYEFYKECINNNIKPIIGLEVIINNYKVVLYAKGEVGYKNLIKINEEEKSLELLNKYSEDLICIVLNKEMFNDLKLIYKDIFIGYKDESNMDKYIYINETLYINKNDKIYYLYLKGIKESKTIDDIDSNISNSLDINNSNIDIKNYNYIYNNCNIELKKQDDLLPIYEVPEGYDSYSYLKEMCKKGLKKRFGETVRKIYIDRIKYELDVINKMGFCNYFLVVMDYVNFAKKNGILVGPGRGSAAGSLVAYVLYITDVDPIRYNLLFERFLNPKRITMPDIDIDFEYDRREEVIEYCINKYGSKKVAGIVTFGTLASRQALRDTARVMDIEQRKIDTFIKLVDSKLNLKDNLNNKEIKELLNKDKELNNLYKIAMRLEGLKRHTSVHAAGIVISNKELDQVLPIVKHDNMYLTCFTMNYLEEIGLLKMDFLALKNLSIITSVIKSLKEDDININFNNIPLNDKKTYELLCDANTTGIFQLEASGMRNFLQKLKPNNIEDLSSALALYRPGPMSNIDTFINRKKGVEKVDYIDSRLEDILKPTYGIIIYQEQIMKIATRMAGFSLGEADLLRRAMSKKKEDILKGEQSKFIEGSIKNGYSKEIALKVFNLILKFASYGFNRSHSVAYSIISYKMAYLKANYNKYFMKSLLDNVIGTSITKEYIYEARLNDLNILNPDINLSDNLYTVVQKGLIYPLSCIKNVGYNAINKIIEERDKSLFKDIFDFSLRCYSMQVNKKVITSLIQAGCFDSFNINHKTLIENLDLIINYVELCRDLNNEEEKPLLIDYNEYSKQELMEQSLEVFGFYLTNHPIIDLRIKNKNLVSIKDMKNYFDKIIDTVLLVDRIKTIDTKNGKNMRFLTCSDELDKIDVVLFPDILEKYPNIKVGDIINIKCKVEKRFDKFQLVLKQIND